MPASLRRGHQVLGGADGLAVDAEDDVARLDQASRGSRDRVDHQRAGGLGLLLLLRAQRVHCQSQALGLAIGRTLGRFGDNLVRLIVDLGDLHVEVLGFFLAPYRQAHIGARMHVGDQQRQLPVMINVLPVDAEDHIAGLDAALFRRSAGLHRNHQRAARAAQAERLGKSGIHVLDLRRRSDRAPHGRS